VFDQVECSEAEERLRFLHILVQCHVCDSIPYLCFDLPDNDLCLRDILEIISGNRFRLIKKILAGSSEGPGDADMKCTRYILYLIPISFRCPSIAWLFYDFGSLCRVFGSFSCINIDILRRHEWVGIKWWLAILLDGRVRDMEKFVKPIELRLADSQD
jgi:hypothetical protein